jgi:hypothetical protein
MNNDSESFFNLPDSFYLPLLSDSSGDVYPSNTLSHFRVLLPQALCLSGSGWECGLAEVLFPHQGAPTHIHSLALIAEADNEESGGANPNPTSSPSSEKVETKTSTPPAAKTPQISPKQTTAPAPASAPTPPPPPKTKSLVKASPQPNSAKSPSPAPAKPPVKSPTNVVKSPPIAAKPPPAKSPSPPSAPTPPPPFIDIGGGVKLIIPTDSSLEGWVTALLSVCPAELLTQYLQSANHSLGGDGNEIFGKFILEGEDGESSSIRWAGRAETIAFPRGQHKSLLDFLLHVAAYCDNEAEARRLLLDMVAKVHARGHRTRQRRSLDIKEGDRIFIYCDAIRSSVCSDFRGKCLRILSYDPHVTRQVLYPIYYFPIEKNCVQTLHVELKTKYNQYFPFDPSDQPLVVVLHFRKMG